MAKISDLRRRAKELGLKLPRTAKATDIETAIVEAEKNGTPADDTAEFYAGTLVDGLDESPLEEHRDATISKTTRDQLAALRGYLYARAAVPAGHRDGWLGAIDDVVSRWDANDATAIEA